MKEFFNQCMLFKSKELFDRALGLFVWVNLAYIIVSIISLICTIKDAMI